MKAKISVVLVAVILVCSLAFAACSAQSKIVGTWTSQKTTLGFVTESSVTFHEDGTGTASGIFGLTGNTTYVINDNILTVTFDIFGVATTKSYSFTIKGDTLTLVDGTETIVFTRTS